MEVTKSKDFYSNFTSNGTSGEFIESLAFYSKSLNDKVSEQIENEALFPTPNSGALEILCDIDKNGYFDGDIEKIAVTCNVYKEYVESIRQRFTRPSGTIALDLQESFLFQLDSIDRKIDDELYNFTKKILKDIAHVDKYASHHRFNNCKDIKYFNNPPALII